MAALTAAEIKTVVSSVEDWIDESFCRKNLIPTSHFFEDFERAHDNVPYRKMLVSPCINFCTVADQCLNYGMATRSTGVFGGKYLVAGKPKNLAYNPKKPNESS